MDFSQFSDEDLLALKAKDYSKLSDEALLALKGQVAPKRQQVEDPIQQAQTLALGAQSMSPVGPSPVPQGMIPKGLPRLDPNQTADAVGEVAAEAGHPLIGGAVQMAPRVADTAYTVAMMGGPKGIAQGVTKGVKATGKGLARLGGRALEGQATQQIGTLRNIVSDLPVDKLAKEAKLEEVRKIASNAIEAAREAAGYSQKMLDAPKDLNHFANIMKSIEPKTKNLTSLLDLRDRAEAAIHAGADSRQAAFIRAGIQKIDAQISTLGKKGKQIAEAYKQYGDVMKASEDVAGDLLKKKVAATKQIRNLAPKAKREQLIRKAGAGVIGAGGLWGLLNSR